MSQEGDHTEDDIALVGEYALHLLDAPERLACEKRLLEEPSLRDLLRAWDEGLADLALEVAEVSPPARVKSAVDARLFGVNQARTQSASISGRLFAWLGGAATLAAALGFAIYFAPTFLRPPAGPTYVAELESEQVELVVEARFDPTSGELGITRMAGSAASGRALELWLIADGAAAPVSLGVLPSEAQTLFTVPEALRAAMVGGTLAISDEPPGGSPTGAPTGAVLAASPVVQS